SPSLSVRPHAADWPRAARHNRFSHGHVFEKLSRRAEELATVFERHMRRKENVTRIAQRRHPPMLEMAGEDYTVLPAGSANDTFDFIAKSSSSHQQKPN